MSTIHTPGRVTFKEDGDANHYSMLTEDGRWWLAVLVNGEQTSERQIANFRRLAACWNRLEPFTTEQIEDPGFDLAGTAEWVALSQELQANLRKASAEQYQLLQKCEQLLAALATIKQITDGSQPIDAAGAAMVAESAIAAVKSGAVPSVCNWRESAPGGWSSDCGQEFWLEDGTPSENSMQFCHKCGKPLAEHPQTDDE